MPGIAQGLIETMLRLKQLQFEEERNTLAREQLGVQKQQAEVANRATRAQILGALQERLKNTTNPNAFIQHIPELSDLTGSSGQFLSTFIGGTPAARQTTVDAAAANAAIDPAVARAGGVAAVTGQTPGAHAQSMFDEAIFGNALRDFQGWAPERKQALAQRVISRQATGQSLGQIAEEEAYMMLTPEEKKQAARVGRQIAPSAQGDAQVRLGWAQLRAQERATLLSADIQQEQNRVALARVQAQNGQEAFNKASEILMARDALLRQLMEQRTTLTREGRRTANQQINKFNSMLRQVSPDVFGDLTDLKDDDDIANLSVINLNAFGTR